jgi:sensor histidine kinase YesM
MVSALVLLEFNNIFSGILFFGSSLLIFVYIPVVWFFLRKKSQNNVISWFRKEVWIVALILVIFSLIAAIEAYSNFVIFTVVFAEIILLLLLFLYENHIKKSPKQLVVKGYSFPNWVYWAFFLGNGLLLVIFEDQFNDNEQNGVAMLFYFSAIILLTFKWSFTQIKTIIDLKNEKAKTELMHLQSQVNPHFFFNMLNNLYGWVDKDSKKAQEIILKLSDMMRYSIYDGQKDRVNLEAEIDYLKNYIDLHKSRYHKNIDVRFSTQIEDGSIQVIPLLFIILLENAFKHGVENLRQNAFINIEMSSTENEIDFFIENNFDDSSLDSNPGIGIKNLKRRLELVYPNNHLLTLESKDQIFTAQLNINLK